MEDTRRPEEITITTTTETKKNTNTALGTRSNAVSTTPKDKSNVTCYECGVTGHYSNECHKKLAKIAPNTVAPAQQQRHVANGRNQNNRNGRFYRMEATEAQEAPNARMGIFSKEHCP